MKQIGIILLLTFLCAVTSLAQQVPKHPNEKLVKSPKYKVGQNVYTTGGLRTLVLCIAINKHSFNSEKILALAQQLRLDFPNEERISVIIFDDFTSAKRFSAVEIHNPHYDKDLKALRGGYFFEKATNVEFIEYSVKRGHSKIKIEIASSKTLGIN